MIESLLEKLGLNKKEIAVFLTVIEQGKITHTAVARITRINRTTVYSVAKELIAKGLIKEDIGGSTSYLTALPPEDLEYIISREEKALELKKRNLRELITELKPLANNAKYNAPKIHFVDERMLEDYLYEQTATWNQSALEHDSTWWGFQDKTFVKHYEAWIDWFWEKAAPQNIQLKVLSNESAEAIKQKQFARRHISAWDNSEEFTATTWIAGDYVINLITSTRPHYLVDMRDPVLAQNLRTVFKKIWNTIQ